MKSYTVVGYAYDADVHCLDCAEARFGALSLQAILGNARPVVDSEGNVVHPIFAGDEGALDEVCGDCFCHLLDDGALGLVVAGDGYADGGEPYTDEELAYINTKEA